MPVADPARLTLASELTIPVVIADVVSLFTSVGATASPTPTINEPASTLLILHLLALTDDMPALLAVEIVRVHTSTPNAVFSDKLRPW